MVTKRGHESSSRRLSTGALNGFSNAARILPMNDSTHLLTHLYQRPPLMQCGKRCDVRSTKRAGHGPHWQSTANTARSRLQISGFGVRVPGGAPASRPRQTSQSAPGPLCFSRACKPPRRSSVAGSHPPQSAAPASRLQPKRATSPSTSNPLLGLRASHEQLCWTSPRSAYSATRPAVFPGPALDRSWGSRRREQQSCCDVPQITSSSVSNRGAVPLNLRSRRIDRSNP